MTGHHTGYFHGWGVCGCRGRIVCTPNPPVLLLPAPARHQLLLLATLSTPPAPISAPHVGSQLVLPLPPLVLLRRRDPLPSDCFSPPLDSSSGHRPLVTSSTTPQSDEHLEPAHQRRRPPGVPGGQGQPAHACVGALLRWAAPGEQLRRRRAGRPGCPGAAVQAAHARLPAVASGQERQRDRGRGRPRTAGTAAGARAAGGRDLRCGAGRAPDRAHRAQDAPDHRVHEPHDRERRRPVPDRGVRRLLRHRRLARHRPQRQGQARRDQEPCRLHRPERPRPRPWVDNVNVHPRTFFLRAPPPHH